VYVISLVFLMASLISLLLGFRQGGLTLIFVSIGCSVLAALFLAASVLRRVSNPGPTERTPERRVDEWRGTHPIQRRPPEPPSGSYPTEDIDVPLATESLVGVVDRPLAGQHGPRNPMPTAVASERPGVGVLGPDVVVDSARGTYHLPGCEHGPGRRSSDRMKRAVARRLGHTPCGVCRPG
jgi:hypothetical protein